MPDTRVQIGQRFRTNGRFDVRVWQVEALFDDSDKLPHARLCEVDRTNEYRTLACEVLLDEERFSRVT